MDARRGVKEAESAAVASVSWVSLPTLRHQRHMKVEGGLRWRVNGGAGDGRDMLPVIPCTLLSHVAASTS